MPTRTEAIKRFLMAKAPKDLAEAYCIDMECQVNVAQDNGERIEGEYKGRQWHGWTDGVQTWKSFRIPYNAGSNPEYTDIELKFDLVNHVEGIGMTGWDWKHRVSKWVAYDFDAIIGHSEKHSKGLNPTELEEIKNAAMDVDWVTVRKSTSGKGIHLYVYIDSISTDNHTEHAALGRAILGKLSAITGYDFHTKVDSCGGNMWVWHRKMEGTTGLQIIKYGTKLFDIPPNWKEHIKVIVGRSRKIPVGKVDNANDFEELIGRGVNIRLDETHKALIKYLEDKKAFFWWDTDHHMLVCHTKDLEDAYADLNMKGIFKTNSPGTNRNEQNAFAFPMRNGAWIVRRFTRGIQEDLSWEQDGQGWTKCYLNRTPTLRIAASSAGGLENEKGDFVFQYAEMAQKAILSLQGNIQLPNWALGRRASIKQHKDGKRIIMEMAHQQEDSMSKGLEGWLLEKGKWKKIFNTVEEVNQDIESMSYDDVARHLVTENLDDAGWVIRSGEKWHQEPFQHARLAIESLGFKSVEVRNILGASIFKPWKLVNRPFQPEYLGDRQWNRNAPQFRFAPSMEDNLTYPTWLKILNHVGLGLNEAVQNNGWCKANGITSGADYLKCWISSMFQEPLEPLPYLFFYGPQGSGKSIFHEALHLLFDRGYVRADNALKSQAGFNGELRTAVLCIIEETDLVNHKQAAARIKDWVTSLQLPIHEKRGTPYLVPNASHWIQCSNDYSACPVFPGDTRITMVYVDCLNPIDLIPKKVLIPMLEKEAPHFLASCLRLEIPKSPDRLNIPVVTTKEKQIAESDNRTLLEIFIEDHCYYAPGESIRFSILYEKFKEWMDPNDAMMWSKIKFGRYFSANSHKYPKGRDKTSAQWYIGNISMVKPERIDEDKALYLEGNMLRGGDHD